MAVDSRRITDPNLRRFEPIDAVLPSTTLSMSTRQSVQKTPVPTKILTDSHAPTEQSTSVVARPVLADTSSQATFSKSSITSSAATAASYTSSAVASSGPGISTSNLIISIVVPLVLIAILVPLIILLCLTCRRKRRRLNRSSHHSQPKIRSPGRQKELLAHRPRGKYGPSIIMRRPNSFSGFDFDFSRPRTVLSRISVKSPKAVTPMNASRSTTLASIWERDERKRDEEAALPRRPALNLVSRYASQDKRIPTGRWDTPGSSPPPPPYARTRPMTLAHPYIPPPLETPQHSDTPRSLSPQLQVATPVEIQRLSGPYTPISQVLRQPEQSRGAYTRYVPERNTRPPLTEHSEIAPTSANLSAPFAPSTSPALTDVSGLSFDPSMWIAAYERDSVVNPVRAEDETKVDPRQLI